METDMRYKVELTHDELLIVRYALMQSVENKEDFLDDPLCVDKQLPPVKVRRQAAESALCKVDDKYRSL